MKSIVRVTNDAKMYLSELLTDNMHTSLPPPMDMRPVEMFEVNVSEIEEEQEQAELI
jgi:hypothetical protein